MSQTDPPSPAVDPLTPTASVDLQTLGTQPAERLTYREIPDYDLLEVIGRGGMGEVVLARDRRIGRDVALKRLRAEHPTPDLVERFLREAKIQARLDHPSIAPVHELGFDSQGLPYFTMKRVAGTTLAELIESRSTQPQRFLRALVDVCHAIELAHSRGYVHRDLKPQNIMLGDYGEVYVLDWGVARVLGSGEDRASEIELGTWPDEVVSLDGVTKTGALLGTPGYMAPEQVRGEPVQPAADIYAIGSMLFEILAGETLHPRGREALATTISNVDGSPSRRRPDRKIAPELDAICARALATEPTERPTARVLADTIQGYLDGDRDIERRRVVASQLTTKAKTSLAAGDREDAIRAAGRALAFDPNSTAASELVLSLVIDEPASLPPEVTAAVEAEEIKMMRTRSRRAVLPYAAIFFTIPLLPLLHVRDAWMLVAVYLAFAMMVLVTWLNSKIGVPIALTLAGHALTALLFTRVIGPFVVTPIMLCAILLSATAIPWLNRRWWAVLAWTITTVLLPFALEWIGLLTPSWTMTPAGLLSHGAIFDAGAVNPVFIIAVNLAAITLVGAYARRIGRDRSDAQRRTFVQAWHLRHLLPKTSSAKHLADVR